MAIARTPVPGLLLVGGISILCILFAVANWYWLEQRHSLQREGVAISAKVDDVIISHKACNSSVRLSWVDLNGGKHSGKFLTCFGNRSPGEFIGIRYLPMKPDTAMIAEGQGGMPDTHYQTGVLFGAIVGAIMCAVTAQLVLYRSRSGPT